MQGVGICAILYLMVSDFMCADYERAARNRVMVRLKLNIEGYLFIENLVRNWPHKKPLPEYLCGHLPTVGKHEGGDLYGFHEVESFSGDVSYRIEVKDG